VERLNRLIAYHPAWVLGVVLALGLGSGLVLVDVTTPALRLKIETAIEKILPTRGPDRDRYQGLRDRFGNDELLFVGLVTDDVFTRENLARIRRMTKRFEEVEGIRTVLSLSNAPDVRSVEGDVSIRSIFEEVPETDAELRALRERVLGNPIHVGTLVSADARATAFLLYPLEMSESEFLASGIDETVEAIAHEEAGGAEILMAGTPPLKATTSRILLRDLVTVVPLGYACMALVAFVMFRSVRAVAIPLLAVTLAQGWTLATMVLFGKSLNLVTFILPQLISAVGFAYSVHVVSEHEEVLREGHRGREAVCEALRRVSFPVFLTGFTTAAGLLSLCLSRLVAIQEFGAFSVVGVAGSLLAALTFVPAVLAILPDPPPRHAVAEGRLEAWAARLAAFDVRHRGWILTAGFLVAVAAAWGLTRIQVSTSFTHNLKPSHPLRQSITRFDESMAGSITLHVVMETDERDAFKDPVRLRQQQELEAWLLEQPLVTKTSSISEYLMVVNRAFHEGDPEYFAIPETKSLVSQYLFFLWYDQLESLVDSRFAAADILVRIPASPTHAIGDLMQRIEAKLATLEGVTAYVTGDTPLIVRTIDEISWGQAVSLSGATLIIYLILVAYFRSLRVAAMALIPNALPVLVYFGILGLTGVTLNVVTSLIACIVLGIAVDDTIHFLVRFKEAYKEVGDEAKATVLALTNVVRPVTATTAALVGGFAVFAASGLKHMVEFGVLAACMLAFAWLVDVTFTPALCARLGLDRDPAESP
jgi:predicted RND superfamily exporter protein